MPPLERQRQKVRVAAANERLLRRSEERRFVAMIKKFGRERAIYLGVPASFVATYFKAKDERKAYARKMQERALARKMRRAERRVLEANGASQSNQGSTKVKMPSREWIS